MMEVIFSFFSILLQPSSHQQELEAEAQTLRDENESLRKSLKDCEELLMDANSQLSHSMQSSMDLQKRVKGLGEENIELSGLQEEVLHYMEEVKALRKEAVSVVSCLFIPVLFYCSVALNLEESHLSLKK